MFVRPYQSLTFTNKVSPEFTASVTQSFYTSSQNMQRRCRDWVPFSNIKSKMATNRRVEKKSKTALFYQIKEAISNWVLVSTSSKVYIYWLVIVTGSLIHDFLPLPQSYLSNKRNVFNMYFVKIGWGWTLGLLIPFMCFTSFEYTNCNPSAMLRHLSRLAVGTFGWYFWVKFFVFIEELTGFCEGEESLTSKRSCHVQGFHWDGFDISGHTFLLTYSALIISEEIQVKKWLPPRENDKNSSRNVILGPIIEAFFICLSLLLLLWEFMLVCTTLYFHTVQQKVLGALISFTTWYVTYGIWYKNNLSPGEPPSKPI